MPYGQGELGVLLRSLNEPGDCFDGEVRSYLPRGVATHTIGDETTGEPDRLHEASSLDLGTGPAIAAHLGFEHVGSWKWRQKSKAESAMRPMLLWYFC